MNTGGCLLVVEILHHDCRSFLTQHISTTEKCEITSQIVKRLLYYDNVVTHGRIEELLLIRESWFVNRHHAAVVTPIS